jgi:plastocyanin
MNTLNQIMRIKALLCSLPAILVSTNIMAGELKISVTSKNNKPLENVVVTLERAGGVQGAASTLSPNKPLSISIMQIDQEFVPAVTVIPVGSLVSFPNQDDILHHVYSFSKAKTFDLPLYKGIPNEPIKFDTAGVASLGCNIHDWMSAHVVIVDTPYYQQTNKLGEVELSNVSAGEYELVLWHPRQKKTYKESITIDDQLLEKSVEIRLKPSFRSKRQDSSSKRNY